jgi:hypothetical protein
MTRTDAMRVDSEADIWERVFRPERGNLQPEAARSILQLSLAPEDRDRMHELAVKGQAGELTARESAELDDY